MADKSFKWGKDGSCPVLEPHSATKLAVLRDYVVDYLQILVRGAMGKETFDITIVDAFAGGGKYSDGEDGSPLVLLKAVREAEALINTVQARQKPLRVNAHFYFIEKDRAAFRCLEAAITSSDWNACVGKNVFLHHDSFENVAGEIVTRTQVRHPKGGSRVIFFMDQCGWSQVPASLIADMAQKLNRKAEFILNFACDWLFSYVSADNAFVKSYEALGLQNLVPVSELLRVKRETNSDYRFAIASKLGPALKAATESEFFSPFYIEPETGSNHGYWLVHLAPHLRARNAMMDVYYRRQTHVRAFGNTGLQMFAFRPDAEPTGYLHGFHLDNRTLNRARQNLAKELLPVFADAYPTGTTFQKLCLDHINSTVATVQLLKEAILLLAKAGELNVHGPQGGAKRVDHIEFADQIELNRAPFLPLSMPMRKARLAD